jgi:hypothetical protein
MYLRNAIRCNCHTHALGMFCFTSSTGARGCQGYLPVAVIAAPTRAGIEEKCVLNHSFYQSVDLQYVHTHDAYHEEEETMTAVTQTSNQMVQRSIGGVVGGVAGGILFGGMMGGMGMLPMVAALVGSTSPVIGFLAHMVISVVIGASFGFLFGGRITDWGSGAVYGLVYGALWWVLGPLVIMPAMMGMGVQFGAAFSTPLLMSLVGHLVYGIVTGLGAVWFSRR